LRISFRLKSRRRWKRCGSAPCGLACHRHRINIRRLHYRYSQIGAGGASGDDLALGALRVVYRGLRDRRAGALHGGPSTPPGGLRADCNHGAGGVTFPQPGAIHIDAVALTRALCPPGSLGGRFARDVARAIRWSLRDAELNLELPEEAGTLQLTRQP
jgi:hypothetical protein